MKIIFFEEYPLRGINYPPETFVAASSVKEFKKIGVPKAGFWPVLRKSYWISPFSDPQELKKLFSSLNNNRSELHVLLDLELPLKKPSLLIKNLPYFFENKKRIKKFVDEAHKKRLFLHTAEYPAIGPFSRWLLGLLGLRYELHANHYHTPMYYTSMLPQFLQKKAGRWLSKQKPKEVALGVIATGAFGSEPVLTPKELERDLEFCKKIGVERVVIYRFRGMSKKYEKVLRKFE